MVTHVVTLYIEGGHLDAETRVCGPFRNRDEAEANREELDDYGQADVLILVPTCADIIREIEGGDA